MKIAIEPGSAALFLIFGAVIFNSYAFGATSMIWFVIAGLIEICLLIMSLCLVAIVWSASQNELLDGQWQATISPWLFATRIQAFREGGSWYRSDNGFRVEPEIEAKLDSYIEEHCERIRRKQTIVSGQERIQRRREKLAVKVQELNDEIKARRSEAGKRRAEFEYEGKLEALRLMSGAGQDTVNE